MRKKWRVLIVALVIVLCGYLLQKSIYTSGCPFRPCIPSHSEIEANRPDVKAILELDKRQGSDLQSKVSNRVLRQSFEGNHYPDLPSELVFSQSGMKVALLREAASKHEIKAWAWGPEGIRRWGVLALRSSEVKRCFLVMGPGGSSSVRTWRVCLYGYYPLKDKDPKPWKLLYVGGASGQTVREDHGNVYIEGEDISGVYIDDELGCLVFTGKRTGKVVHAIRIEHEIELMQKH